MAQTKKGLKKSFDEFSDLLILKVIFDNLKGKKKKQEFIALLEGEKQRDIDTFLRTNIKNLEKKIVKESQREVGEMAKKK